MWRPTVSRRDVGPRVREKRGKVDTSPAQSIPYPARCFHRFRVRSRTVAALNHSNEEAIDGRATTPSRPLSRERRRLAA
jgi:hypothetical protein